MLNIEIVSSALAYSMLVNVDRQHTAWTTTYARVTVTRTTGTHAVHKTFRHSSNIDAGSSHGMACPGLQSTDLAQQVSDVDRPLPLKSRHDTAAVKMLPRYKPRLISLIVFHRRRPRRSWWASKRLTVLCLGAPVTVRDVSDCEPFVSRSTRSLIVK